MDENMYSFSIGMYGYHVLINLPLSIYISLGLDWKMIKALAGRYVNQGGETNQGESSKSSQRSAASGMSCG